MTIDLHILTTVRKTISYREFIQATLKILTIGLTHYNFVVLKSKGPLILLRKSRQFELSRAKFNWTKKLLRVDFYVLLLSLCFCVLLCRSLFVLLSLLFRSLHCLSFDLLLLITSLVSSNFPASHPTKWIFCLRNSKVRL
jgi:hypothetical protein